MSVPSIRRSVGRLVGWSTVAAEPPSPIMHTFLLCTRYKKGRRNGKRVHSFLMKVKWTFQSARVPLCLCYLLLLLRPACSHRLFLPSIHWWDAKAIWSSLALHGFSSRSQTQKGGWLHLCLMGGPDVVHSSMENEAAFFLFWFVVFFFRARVRTRALASSRLTFTTSHVSAGWSWEIQRSTRRRRCDIPRNQLVSVCLSVWLIRLAANLSWAVTSCLIDEGDVHSDRRRVSTKKNKIK